MLKNLVIVVMLVVGLTSEAMNWVVVEGIIEGGDGNLNPKASVTRAEVIAIMMMRFMDK